MNAAVLALVCALGIAAMPEPARAVLTIRITESTEAALPIAIVPFGFAGGAAGARAPENIGQIVADDLARTGRFDPIAFPDLPSRPSSVADVNFGDWRILGTANLVIGRVEARGPEQYAITFRLFDVFRATQLAGFEIVATTRDLRRTAHQISDIVYETLTGERGAFDTRVAYVTEGRDANGERRYALQVADSDGANPFPVLDSVQPILSPSWSPDGARLAYVSYEAGRPQVYVQELATGRRDAVAAFPGTNGAPAFSPDGSRLALTLSKDGNHEIYVLDLAGRRLRRITDDPAIDTEPAWSPDGASIVFTSDRGGKPQIYQVPASGGEARRMTFVASDDYNARASFSPDGRRLAFVHGVGGRFRIAVLDLETSAVNVLTDTRLDESPSFAPNGTMILYATVSGGSSVLAAVSTDGRMRQQLAATEGKAREPAWSPFRSRR